MAQTRRLLVACYFNEDRLEKAKEKIDKQFLFWQSGFNFEDMLVEPTIYASPNEYVNRGIWTTGPRK
jgi:hypothetical protein